MRRAAPRPFSNLNHYIRIIVTTNFDRLLESALKAEGVQPVIISSPDAAKGAPPFCHSKCTILKLHGDYLDHRIKNSEKDLSEYSESINKALDQIFDEYGLIVSGWSGAYDIALRDAMERKKSKRYLTYWTGIDKPHELAQQMINFCGAHFIKIENADELFGGDLEKLKNAYALFQPEVEKSIKKRGGSLICGQVFC